MNLPTKRLTPFQTSASITAGGALALCLVVVLWEILPALLWAGVLVIALWPSYSKICRWRTSHVWRNAGAPLLFTCVVGLVIAAPIALATVEINHSDVGGSYPEDESRLSDVTLNWMLEQLASLPSPLFIDAQKLRTFPDPAGMQHCEVDARRDGYPSWLPARFRVTWAEKPRIAVLGAPVHSSVVARFAQPAVLKWGRFSPYRPETLRNDPRFSHYYE